MDRFVANGVPPYDGEWEIDLSYFTNRELHTIKRMSGVRGGELEDALAKIDNDVGIALFVIALERSKKFPNIVEDIIWEARSDAIRFVEDEAAREDDAGPPAQPPVTEPGPGETGEGNG